MSELTTERLEKLQDNLLQFQDAYSDPADKENYDIFVDALHVLDEFKAAKEKLLAYEQAAKNEVALPEALKYAEIYGRAFICVDRNGSVHAVDPSQITLTILNEPAPVLPKQPAPTISFYLDGILAAAQWVEKQREAYDSEHGQRDPDTGAFEFGNDAQRDYSETLAEIAEGIRALHPNAALVLPLVSFDELMEAVSEVTGVKHKFDATPEKCYQAVPFMNFNSLSRIVEMFRTAQPVIPEQALNPAKLINKFYERYPLETFAKETERAEALGYFMAGAELQCFGEFIAYDDHVQESE